MKALISITLEMGIAHFHTYSASLNITVLGLRFVEDSTTRHNFSPSLGETAEMRVEVIPPPSGHYSGYTFHIGIVRELSNGTDQHIDWVNVQPEQGPGAYYNWRDVDFQSKVFTWNGIPSVPFGQSALISTGRDVFTGADGNTVNIRFPAVTAGQPVPPPFYTAVAMIKGSNNNVITETRKRIFVPQVVKMVYEADAVSLMKQGRFNTAGTTNIIQKISDPEWEEMRTSIPAGAQEFIDLIGANIRFVCDSTAVSPPYKTIRIVNRIVIGNRHYSALGITRDFSFMNESMIGTGYVGMGQLYDIFPRYSNVDNGTFALPVKPHEIRSHCIRTTLHECGHMFGLVADNNVLGGDNGKHNLNPSGGIHIMDDGTAVTYERRFRRPGHEEWRWRELNEEYLKFILPKEEKTP